MQFHLFNSANEEKCFELFFFHFFFHVHSILSIGRCRSHRVFMPMCLPSRHRSALPVHFRQPKLYLFSMHIPTATFIYVFYVYTHKTPRKPLKPFTAPALTFRIYLVKCSFIKFVHTRSNHYFVQCAFHISAMPRFRISHSTLPHPHTRHTHTRISRSVL